MNEFVQIDRITGMQRLTNCPDGNPRYRVFSEAGYWDTSPGSAVVYGITNTAFKEKPLRLELNGRKQIVGVSNPDGSRVEK